MMKPLDAQAVFETVANILRQHDPLTLVTAANHDEYDAEARLIASRLSSCRSLAGCRTLVWEVFRNQFDTETVGKPEDWTDLADAIWNATHR